MSVSLVLPTNRLMASIVKQNQAASGSLQHRPSNNCAHKDSNNCAHQELRQPHPRLRACGIFFLFGGLQAQRIITLNRHSIPLFYTVSFLVTLYHH